MPYGSRLLDCRSIAVQICDARRETIAGTGFLVGADKVVTCAHVLCHAGYNPAQDRTPGFFALVFGRAWDPVVATESIPYVDPKEKQAWRRHIEDGRVLVRRIGSQGKTQWQRPAKLLDYFSDSEDDAAVLQLVGDPVNVELSHIARLADIPDVRDRPFRCYGYPQDQGDAGGYRYGLIKGSISPPSGTRLRVDPLELAPQDVPILPGMSGAAVLDDISGCVVGIVVKSKESRTGFEKIAWATNSRALRFLNVELPPSDQTGLFEPLPYPHTDIAAARAAAVPSPGNRLPDPDPWMRNWVGRSELLDRLWEEWNEESHRVVAVIGFGGEGKSLFVRRWIDRLLEATEHDLRSPVFWWTFETPEADSFLAEAHAWMTGGKHDPTLSSGERAHAIAAMLATQRYLFVLDGLEILQQSDGYTSGNLTSSALSQFLTLFATPHHNAFCLITSRLSSIELATAREYTEYPLGGLSSADGRALLRKLGVEAPDRELDTIVSTWSGHALILTLIGGYISEKQKEAPESSPLPELPAPDLHETRYDRVHRVLAHYDERTDPAGRALMMLCSLLRTPISNAVLAFFRTDWGVGALNAPLAPLNRTQFDDLLARQVNRRILRKGAAEDVYDLHPLIREHYRDLARQHPGLLRAAHLRIKDYYLSLPGVAEAGTVGDLSPLIEAVYHACRGSEYDAACRLYCDTIETGKLRLSVKLNAFDTVAAALREFFPDGDTAKAPMPSAAVDQRYILNRYGVALMNTGRLREAPGFYERAIDVAQRAGDRLGATHSAQNLSEGLSYLGLVAASLDAARRSLALAEGLDPGELRNSELRDSLTRLGWAAFLAGDVELARTSFERAERLQREFEPEEKTLYDIGGVAHADFLRRMGGADDLAYALEITRANLARSQAEDERDNISICHRVLGDIEAARGRDQRALEHYNRSVDDVRKIDERTVLIEALLARGRWSARRGNIDAARPDLADALYYASAGGYGAYEADLRVALAWMHFAEKNMALALREADRASELSDRLGYHWGRVDAEEIRQRCLEAG